MISRGVFIVVCAWNINNHTVFPYSVWSCFSPVERALGRWIFRQGSAMASLQLRSLLVRLLLHSSHPTIKIETSLELEKAMAPYSSTLAWKIPWMEEPGRLQSMGSLRIGHDWVTSLSLFTFIHWRRKWQPAPVFLPGESQGRRSLVGCPLWGRTELDTTEET